MCNVETLRGQEDGLLGTLNSTPRLQMPRTARPAEDLGLPARGTLALVTCFFTLFPCFLSPATPLPCALDVELIGCGIIASHALRN